MSKKLTLILLIIVLVLNAATIGDFYKSKLDSERVDKNNKLAMLMAGLAAAKAELTATGTALGEENENINSLIEVLASITADLASIKETLDLAQGYITALNTDLAIADQS